MKISKIGSAWFLQKVALNCSNKKLIWEASLSFEKLKVKFGQNGTAIVLNCNTNVNQTFLFQLLDNFCVILTLVCFQSTSKSIHIQSSLSLLLWDDSTKQSDIDFNI